MTRNVIGSFLAGLGVSVILTELLQHWFRAAYPIGAAVVAVGAALGFVGFYMLNPQQAEDGGGFIVDSTVKILAVIRGRRAGDPSTVVVASAAPTAVAHPAPAAPPVDHGKGDETGEAP